jgi:hypothetical protein
MSAQIDFEKTEALLSAEPEIDFAATEQGLRAGFLYAQPLEPTAWETANIIGREVIPAIGGAMLGSMGGPWGTVGGGAAGSSWGNYLSQQYRIDRGLQSGINPGEMVAATVAGAIPFGALPGKGALARTAIRGVQGATVATAETAGRTLIDEGRAPTQDELLTSVLFGGTIGGVMGAGEAAFAKWKSGAPFEGGENRSGALALIEKEFTEATPFNPRGKPGPQRQLGLDQPRLDDKPIINSLALETAGDGNILVLEDKIILPPVRGSGGEVISLDDAPDWVNIGGKQTRDISALQKKLDALVDEGKITKKERAKLIRNARKREFGTDRVFTSVPEGEQAFDPRFYDLIDGEYVQKAVRRTTAIQLAQDVLDVTQADLANDVSGYVKRIAQSQAGSLSEQDEGLRNLLESGLTQSDFTRKIHAATQDPVTGKVLNLDVKPEDRSRMVVKSSVVGEEERLARVAAGEQQPSAAAGLMGMMDTQAAQQAARKSARDQENLFVDAWKKTINSKGKLTDPTVIKRLKAELDGYRLKDSEWRAKNENHIKDAERQLQALEDPGSIIPSVAIAGAGISQMTADEREELFAKADMTTILLALAGLALGVKGLSVAARTVFRRSPEFKAATNPKTRARVAAQQPNSPNSPNTGYESTIKATLNPDSVASSMGRMIPAVTSMIANLAEPLSRTLKSVGRKWDEKSGTLKINKYFAGMMRAVEKDAATEKTRFREKLIPIVNRMYTKTSKTHHEAIDNALLHTSQDGYSGLLKTLEGANKNVNWSDELNQLRAGLAEVRAFGREQGGINIGELEDYFPRHVMNRLSRNPKMLRQKLRDEGLLNDDSDLTRALNAEAKIQDRTSGVDLSDEDAAAVIQKYVAENLHRKAGGMPSGAKQRRIEQIDEIISDYYSKPIDGMEAYIDGIVEKSVWNRFKGDAPKIDRERDRLENIKFTEDRKKVLLQQMESGEASVKKVAGGKFRVSYVDGAGKKRTATLNTKVPVSDGIAKVAAVNKIAALDLERIKGARIQQRKDLGAKRDAGKTIGVQLAEFRKKHGALSAADQEIVDEAFKSRMQSTSGMSPFLREAKDLGYLMVLSNLGSVMTQFGDVFFSLHRNGLNATMQAAVKREYDLAKKFGISTYELNNMTSSGGGVAKVLNKVFTGIGFSQLDKFGANTFLNARYAKMKNQARAGGAAEAKLRAELDEYGGFLDTNQVIYDLKTNNLTDSVEAVLYNEILDVRPASLSEMSGAYVKNPNGRIFYMLKSYQLKQIDYFREHSENQILQGKLMLQQGKPGGAKQMAEGLTGLVGMAVLYAGVTGSVDVVKDLAYGRPIDMDDKMSDATWRLFGLSRYFPYQVRREGPLNAARDWLLPPLSAYSRPFKDITSIEDGFAGETTRGMFPGDFYYWWFGGGRDKIKRDLERKSD